MNNFRRRAMAVLAFALACGATWAQNTTPSSSTGSPASSVQNTTPPGGQGSGKAQAKGAKAGGGEAKLSRSEVAFLKNAEYGDLAEIETSKLAQTRAANAQVKTFADQMIADHMKTSNELHQLADAKGVKLPSAPSLTAKAKFKLLRAAEGANFDRRYVDTTGVKAHEDMLKLFHKQAREAKDPDVKAFAERTLPALESHLQMAKQLQTVVAAEGNEHGASAERKLQK
jgi:putative membrane protein